MGAQVKRCVLVGAAPIADYDLFSSRLSGEDVIACADGGGHHLLQIGRVPDVLAGDFDSLQGAKQAGEVITLPREKDDTDTHFLAMLMQERGCHEFLMLGMTGGRLDHTLANISTAAALTRRGCRVILADETAEMTLIENASIRLAPVKGAILSVFPWECSAAGVTERGLKYSLDRANLSPLHSIGVSNEFTDEDAQIFVEKGMLLIICTKTEDTPEPSFPLLRII